MNVLITNICLNGRTGTELYVRDLALELKRCGHNPVVYTPAKGIVAEEIRSGGVVVTDRLAGLDFRPDIIHGHHRDETMAALLAFPGVPGIFICHDAVAWHDQAPLFPRIHTYLAVSYFLRERLIRDGVPEHKTRVVHNFVDMGRFLPRAALPEYPGRALAFSNAVSDETYLPAIREACACRGIELDVAGLAEGRVLDRPEEVLGGYDLVFAKGKAALEALAVGAAVIVCDAPGVGPMVTTAGFARQRDLNLGLRLLTQPHSAEVIGRLIDSYDARDAALVRDIVRLECGLDTTVEKLVAIYRDAIARQHAPRDSDHRAERAAARLYLKSKTFPPSEPRVTRLKARVGEIPVAGSALRWVWRNCRRPPWRG